MNADDTDLTTEDLQREVRRRDALLSVHREFCNISFQEHGFCTKAWHFLDLLIDAMDVDLGMTFLVEEDELSLAASKGPLAEYLLVSEMSVGEGMAGKVAASGEPSFSTNLISTVKLFKDELGLNVERSTICVPLKFRGRTTSVIQIVGKHDIKYGESDLDFLMDIIDEFSLIAEKSYVFNDLEDKVKDTETLYEVATLLVSSLDEREIRQRAIESITAIMDVEAGSLLILDDEVGELFFEVALGDSGAKVKEIRLKVGEGIAGWVAEHNESLIVSDVTKDDRFNQRADKHSDFKTRNLLCVPVSSRGKVMGVLQAVNKKHGQFLDRDRERFELFASQVAIALENANLHSDLRQTFFDTSEALAQAIEKRDPYTGGHTKRVVTYSVAIGERLGLSMGVMDTLKLSAILHDVGKIGVDDAVLRKQAKLDDEEFGMMKGHPMMGAEILRLVPKLKDVIPGMLYHHERVDGRGYPDGLSGDEIPLIARIISVADTFDAMTSSRPYRKGLPTQVAIDELEKHSGTQFDTLAVKAFLEALEASEVVNICEGDDCGQ